MIFLIVYDRQKARILEFRSYTDAEHDTVRHDRLAREIASNGSQAQLEIVQLEAASEEDLRRTHRRYFESVAEIASSKIG